MAQWACAGLCSPSWLSRRACSIQEGGEGRKERTDLPVSPAVLGLTYLTSAGHLCHLLSVAKPVWCLVLSPLDR